MSSHWRDRLLLTGWLLVAFFPGTAGVSLIDRDEGFYAQITKEMVQTGDWIMPRYLGEPRLFKPPIVYWGAAVSVSILGFSEFALRLPGLLASVLAWVVAAEYAGRWFGRSAAWWTAAIAGGCVGTKVAAGMMLTDGYLLLFTTLAMCLWIDRLQSDSPPDSRQWSSYVFWAACGGAVMAKGPAVLIVMVPFALGLLLVPSGRADPAITWRRRLVQLWPGPGWWLGALIPLPWFAAIAWLDWPRFKHEFLLQHSLNRAGAPMEGHAGFIGYYVLCGMFLLWPWAAWMPRAVGSAWTDARHVPAVRGLLIWLLAGGAAFEIIRTKLPHYGLVLTPPVIMLTARCFGSRLIRQLPSTGWQSRLPWRRLLLVGISWVILVAVLDLPSALRMLHGLSMLGGGIAITAGLLMATLLWPQRTWIIATAGAGAGMLSTCVWLSGRVEVAWVAAAGAILLLTAIAMTLAWNRQRGTTAAASLMLGMMAFHQIVGWKVLPLGEPHRLSRNVADAVNSLSPPVDFIITSGFAEPSMFYYSRPPGREFRAESWIPAETAACTVALVALPSRLASLQAHFEFDPADGRIVSGFNYVRGRRTDVWIGRAKVREQPVAGPSDPSREPDSSRERKRTPNTASTGTRD